MASYLPAQESEQGTYMTVAPIHQAVTSLTSTASHAQVGRVWLNILLYTFPLPQNYMVAPEPNHGRGRYDLVTDHYVTYESGGHDTIKLFLLEVEGAEGEGQEGQWSGARTQLHQYLSDMVHDSNARPVYGAIAFGRYNRHRPETQSPFKTQMTTTIISDASVPRFKRV